MAKTYKQRMEQYLVKSGYYKLSPRERAIANKQCFDEIQKIVCSNQKKNPLDVEGGDF